MADLDTRAKRFSMLNMMNPSRVLAVPPSGSVGAASRAQFLLLYAGISLIAATPPADDDTKDNAGNTLTITSFSARDGTKLRAPRITLLHAYDSAANADLIGPDRADMDRHTIRSSRMGRLPNTGRTLRLLMFVSRAGEVFAPKSLVLSVSAVPRSARVKAADTTSRTARDGTKMTVPEVQVMHAADSGLNADLKVVGTDQDRFYTQHDIDRTVALGTSHRLLVMGLGRAGSAGPVVKSLVLEIATAPGKVRAKARST